MTYSWRHSFCTVYADRYHRCLLAILLVGLANFLLAFHWGLPLATSPETTTPWPVDVIAPVPPLTEAYYLFTRRGTDPVIYPLLHYIVLDLAYAPYVLLQYLLGNLNNPNSVFPYGAVDPGSFFRDLNLIAQAVSLAMALGIVVTLYRIGRELFSPQAGLWSALIACLLPPMAFYAKTANLDVPYLFWTVLAVWYYVRILQEQRLKHYLAFGVCVALGVATKDQAYGFFVITPILLAYGFAKSRAPSGVISVQGVGRAFLAKPLWLGGLAAIIAFALANNLLFGGWDGFRRHLSFATSFYQENLISSDPARHGFMAQLQRLVESGQLLGEMLGYGTLALCIAGVAYAAVHKRWLALSLPLLILGYYISVLAVAGVTYSRHMLGPALLLVPFGGAFIAYLTTVPHPAARRTGWVIVVICLGYQGFLSAHLNWTLWHDSRYQMESWLQEHIAPGSTIETQVQHRYLPRISDRYHVTLVGNTLDPIKYDVRTADLTPEALARRDPSYILVMKGLGVTGDPETMHQAELRSYFSDLLGGKLGYRVIAQFETPTLLSYRQVTAGTQPTTILLERVH